MLEVLKTISAFSKKLVGMFTQGYEEFKTACFYVRLIRQKPRKSAFSAKFLDKLH